MATLNGSFKTIHSEIWPTTNARTGSEPDVRRGHRIFEELIPIPISAPAEIRSPTDWLEQLSLAVMVDGVQYVSLVDKLASSTNDKARSAYFSAYRR